VHLWPNKFFQGSEIYAAAGGKISVSCFVHDYPITRSRSFTWLVSFGSLCWWDAAQVRNPAAVVHDGKNPSDHTAVGDIDIEHSRNNAQIMSDWSEYLTASDTSRP
jgi:expansin (peptidoglycan-binding protein)